MHFDPVGPGNDLTIASMLISVTVGRVVAAWGAHGSLRYRDATVIGMARRPLYALGLTKAGQPKHPLARGREHPDLHASRYMMSDWQGDRGGDGQNAGSFSRRRHIPGFGERRAVGASPLAAAIANHRERISGVDDDYDDREDQEIIERIMAELLRRQAAADEIQVRQMLERIDEHQPYELGDQHCVLLGFEDSIDAVWSVPDPRPEVLRRPVPVPPRQLLHPPTTDETINPSGRVANYRRVGEFTYKRES